jgi:hypothetical protein
VPQDIRKNVVYSPRWQALRISLLGRWGFIDGVHINMNVLRRRLDSENTVNNCWCALNLINGVMMGYHAQKTKYAEHIQILKILQNDVRSMYQEHLKYKNLLQEVTEEQVRREWGMLAEATKRSILTNLSHRLSRHEESEHREDLRWFLNIVERL